MFGRIPRPLNTPGQTTFLRYDAIAIVMKKQGENVMRLKDRVAIVVGAGQMPPH
jgi:hypothetical protein